MSGMPTIRLALVIKHVMKSLALARSVAFDSMTCEPPLNIYTGKLFCWQIEVLKWLQRRQQPTRLGVFFAAF